MSLLDDRCRNPLHEGALASANAVGQVGNPACGDVLTLRLRIENDLVVEGKFESWGSPFQLATADVLIDCILNQSLDYAARRGPSCVLLKLPDLPRTKHYLARLASDALHRALRRFQSGQLHEPHESEYAQLYGDDAEAFLLDLLDNERRWGTGEITAICQAEGVKINPSAIRVLTKLRKEERIEGAWNPDYNAWRWWR